MLKHLQDLAVGVKEAMHPPLPKASGIIPLMLPVTALPSYEREGVELKIGDAELSPECFLGQAMDDGSLHLSGPVRFRYQDSVWVQDGRGVVRSTEYTHWITKARMQAFATRIEIQ